MSLVVFGLLMVVWLGSTDGVKTSQSFDNMKFTGIVKDGSQEFIIYEDDRGYVRWYRTIVVIEDIRYISGNPALIVKGNNEILIRVRWDPNDYADCKAFKRISAGDPEGFCKRYHLPVSEIRSRCGGF